MAQRMTDAITPAIADRMAVRHGHSTPLPVVTPSINVTAGPQPAAATMDGRSAADHVHRFVPRPAGRLYGKLRFRNRCADPWCNALQPEGTPTSAWAEFERCHRCGGRNVCWYAPSPLWNLVMRGNDINGDALYDDLVCIGCFFELAEKAGVAGRWKVTVDPEPDGLKTTTPSGRVWNPETWQWETP